MTLKRLTESHILVDIYGAKMVSSFPLVLKFKQMDRHIKVLSITDVNSKGIYWK
jgi:hypothetical protein